MFRRLFWLFADSDSDSGESEADGKKRKAKKSAAKSPGETIMFHQWCGAFLVSFSCLRCMGVVVHVGVHSLTRWPQLVRITLILGRC